MVVTIRTSLASLVAFALACSSAQASTVVDASVPVAPYVGWVTASLVPTPDVSVDLAFDDGICDDGVACAAVVDGRPHISLTRFAIGRRWVFLHELGHVFDATVMTDDARAAFLKAARWHGSGGWFDGDHDAMPAEWFADAYARCAIHQRIRRARLYSTSFLPGPRSHQRVCRVIRQAAVGVYGRRALTERA